jgi:hypothetical protein
MKHLPQESTGSRSKRPKHQGRAARTQKAESRRAGEGEAARGRDRECRGNGERSGRARSRWRLSGSGCLLLLAGKEAGDLYRAAQYTPPHSRENKMERKARARCWADKKWETRRDRARQLNDDNNLLVRLLQSTPSTLPSSRANRPRRGSGCLFGVGGDDGEKLKIKR